MVYVVHRKPITVDRQRSFWLLIAAESPLVFSYSFQEMVTGNEAHGTESSNFIMNNIFLNGDFIKPAGACNLETINCTDNQAGKLHFQVKLLPRALM